MQMFSALHRLLTTQNKHRGLLLLLGLAPVVFALYVTFLVPRPCYIIDTDLEHDYYYNARLLYAGLPVVTYNHPGTPIYYLGRLIILITGPDVEAVQLFFNVAYFVVALATAASLCIFAYLLLKGIPIGTSIMVLGSIVAWPSFLTYMNYFGSESFIVVLGLLTIALFWKTLTAHNTPDKLALFLCGIGVGACLATKMSFLPVSLALLAGCLTHILVSTRHNGLRNGYSGAGWLTRRMTRLLIMPFGAALSYFILTAPILWALPSLWATTVLRGAVFGAKDPDILFRLLFNFSLLFKTSLPLAILLIAATGAFLCLFAKYIYRRLRWGKSLRSHGLVDVPEFDYISGGVFLLLMLLGFVFTMCAEVHLGPDAGVGLRQVAPSALVVPFLILYCYQLNQAKWIAGTRRSQVILAIAGVVVVTFAVIIHVDNRHEFITSREAQIVTITSELTELRYPDTRIAYWGPAHLFGQASFHFWGNYRYASNSFDRLLLERYPEYAFFRLREVPRILGTPEPSEVRAKPYITLKGWYITLEGYWHKIFPPPCLGESTNEVITGETQGVKVSIIAFPRSAQRELREATLSQLLALLQSRFGTLSYRIQCIEGTDWVIISLHEYAQ